MAAKIQEYLPPEMAGFLRRSGEIAAGGGQELYLVGGTVRDLLLGQANLDIDLVTEGDAIRLATVLASQGKITRHPRFGTAKIEWNSWSIDITTARSETYARPGALPAVKPGSMREDLFRRDFTINAMAIYLSPARFGELLDPYGGEADLRLRLVRILHENSFIDDATRIWRALRYEQRLDFELESRTLQLLKRDIPMLDTISADRLRYEVECVLRERYPEKVIRRAGDLSVLSRLHPALPGDDWLAAGFEEARRLSSPGAPSMGLYLALLAYRLNSEEIEALISRLNLPRTLAKALRDSATLKGRLGTLGDPAIAPSRIYHLLEGCSPGAMEAVAIASGLPAARQRIGDFLTRLRYVKPALTGDDLKNLGVKLGPDVGRLLDKLLDARLDGRVTTRQGEDHFVRRWLAEHS